MANIGFIGLGHMGHPMVLNLLKAGHQLKVFDVVPQAVQSLVDEGASAADNAGDAAAGAEVVFTMLQTGEQVLGVCHGEHGIFKHIDSNALFIDSSSIAINDTRRLHTEAEKMGLAMVDAPVSGGVKGAEAAVLTIMVGGSEADYQRAKTYLDCLGKAVIHAGPSGNGQAAKICNNMVLAISMIGISEAFVLAEKLGLDAKKLFDICSQASGQCWALTSYCPSPNILDNVPSNNNYQPGFTASMMLKDLNLSQDASHTAHAKTELGAKAHELYQRYVDQGHGDIDFSGIINMIKTEE